MYEYICESCGRKVVSNVELKGKDLVHTGFVKFMKKNKTSGIVETIKRMCCGILKASKMPVQKPAPKASKSSKAKED